MKWWRWSRRAEQWEETLRAEAYEHVGDSAMLRGAAIVVSVVALVLLALGLYWNREPAPFDVAGSVHKVLREPVAHPAPGAVTVATLMQVVTTLLDKPGGFINNDIVPPGVWLDDIPGWEHGALLQARDMTRSLRDDFGRAAGSAEPDDDLARAAPRLSFSDSSWMLPSSESQYRDAREYLRAYLLRVQNGGEPVASFVATPATLELYLARVTSRLDVIAQRLSACVAPSENPLFQSRSLRQPGAHTTTPSSQIDDVFYEARGSAWALLHLLRAIEIDFAGVLREKSAQDTLHEAIRALDATQDTIYSPVILNGSGFGLLANHSLVMASYIARADTAVATVRRLLTATAVAPGATIESVTPEQEANP